MKSIIYLTFLTFLSIKAIAQENASREDPTSVKIYPESVRMDLLSQNLATETISKVDVQEITLAPSKTVALHKHPCPVFGYVVEGTLLFQVQGQKSKTLKKGAAFYEPAQTEIIHFDNASSEHPLKFVAFYPNNGEGKLIEMLPANH
jgi:quercetin dioxygenase-like cupin family protein